MAGFGEMLNVIGVANGCPQLGAFIQIIGLGLVLNAYIKTIDSEQKLNLLTIFLGIPVLLFLVPNQKHQLTGILITSLCFLHLRKTNRFTSTKLTLFLAILLFAASIKYSFLLSFASLLLFYTLKKPGGVTFFDFLVKLTLLSAIILGPQLLFRWFFLGDPLSPLLESFTPKADSVIIKLYTAFYQNRYYKYFILTARFQLFILIPFLVTGVYTLASSLFSDSQREKVLLKSSNGYAESKWIDEVLPLNARICIASRSRAFLPRPYFPWEYLHFTSMEVRTEAGVLDRKLKEYKIDYIILPPTGFEAIRSKYAGEVIAGPKKFSLATRNPFNSSEYEMVIYKMK